MRNPIGTEFSTKRNGRLVVTGYTSSTNVEVRFLETGFRKITSMIEIRRGTVKDPMRPTIFNVGFIGDGKYKAKVSGRMTDQYVCYSSMMARCYSENYQKKKPTYVGCTVCTHWHNFQNFAEWYDENYPRDGMKYELDKDTLVEGNKIYSPDTCVFISSELNSQKAHSKEYRLRSPSGLIVHIQNLSKFSKENNLQQSHMSAVAGGKRLSHKGWTLPD